MPDDNNIKGTVILVCVAGACFAVMYTDNPISDTLVDYYVNSIPHSQDVELGLKAVQDDMATGELRPYHDHRVASIGRQLVRGLPNSAKDYRFEFRAVRDDDFNAFAYPGGFIFVNSGLLKDVKSDDEIAGVLAHEIGHVLRRHSQKRIFKSQLGDMLLKVLTYSDNDGRSESAGQAMGEVLLGYANHFGKMAFSRSNEYEADDTGFDTMSRAGMDGRGLVKFFRRLLSMEGGKSGMLAQWESTHPGTKERISALEAKAAKQGTRRQRAAPASQGRYKDTLGDFFSGGSKSAGYFDNDPHSSDPGFVTVTVPRGARPGSSMVVTFPDGRRTTVTLPYNNGRPIEGRTVQCYSPSDTCWLRNRRKGKRGYNDHEL